MAVLFVTLGHVSPDPLDHPRWLMAGSRPVLICYTVLMGFCVPVLYLYAVLMAALQTCGLASHDLHDPLGQIGVVAYPLIQGAIYGGATWMIVLLANIVLGMLSRWRISPDSPGEPGRHSRHETSPENELKSRQTKPQTKATSSGRTRRALPVVMSIGILYSIASVLVLTPTLPSTWTANFDRSRYAEIREAIRADEHHLLGKSLDEVSKRFRLESVPWDDASFQGGPGSSRIYHFRGFAFFVMVAWELPEDSSLRRRGWYTNAELQRYGVLRLANQCPFVRVDGIDDPKERMKRYWDAIDEECARINARMERERQGAGDE